MDMLMAALHDAVACKALIVMVLMWALTSLIMLIEPRGASLLALAAMTLLQFANLFCGDPIEIARLAPRSGTGMRTEAAAGESRDRCFELSQALDASRGNLRTCSNAQSACEATACTHNAVSTGRDVARNGRGSARQVETAR